MGVSDRVWEFLTESGKRSGLLNPNMFDNGDEIMAHKGFHIRDLTDKLTCQFFLDPGINLKLMKLLLT